MTAGSKKSHDNDSAAEDLYSIKNKQNKIKKGDPYRSRAKEEEPFHGWDSDQRTTDLSGDGPHKSPPVSGCT